MRHCITVRYPGEFSKSFVTERRNTNDQGILRQIFDEWNAGSGRESCTFLASQCRSLSINDLVGIDERIYQCASPGWEPVTLDYAIQLEHEVRNHPLFNVDPMVALDRIMWDRRKSQKALLNLALDI